jgi:hypothetical protein
MMLYRNRYLDGGYRWKDNDLLDMWYLSCAAAYCDYTVAERGTGRQLHQVFEAQGKTPKVFVTLAELVAALNRDNVKTATERAADSTH